MAIVNNQALGFIKKQFNTVADAQAAATAGKIVFDSKSHIIFVDGQAYGGNITDATFTNSVLTITKSVGDPVVIDFSDVASAKAMMNVFQQLYDTIGLTTVGSESGLDYSGTNYLSELGQQGKPDKNLVNADKLLDSKIKGVDDKISAMDGTAGIASVNNGVVTLKTGVIQTDGVISNDSGSGIDLAKVATTGDAADVNFTTYIPEGLGSGEGIDATNVQDAIEQVVDKIIENEEVTTEAIAAIQTSTGLDENLQYVKKQGANYIGNATDITDAVNILDEKLAEVSGGGVTDVKINGTSIKSNNEANIAVDGTYNAESNKVATESTVDNAINDLDVTGFAQASTDTTTTQGQTTLSINGIKEEDGKIATDTTTKTDIVIDGTYNASTNKIATESTITTRIQALDGSATIASKNGNVVTIKTGVTETDGIISNDSGTDIVLEEVAVTGAAADVSIADAEGKITATTVEGALTELAKAIEALQGAFDVVVSTDAATTPQGVKWGNPEVTGTLEASKDTFHKIYLVPAGGTTPNTYSEYITTRTGAEGSYTYGWEKLGDIAVDLTGYVKTLTVNGKEYAVASNSTNISLGDVVTAVTGETAIAGGNSDYVAVTATTTKDTTTGSNTVAITSTVKTHTVADATDSGDGLATAKNVKDYVDTKAAVVNSDPTIKVNDTTSAQIGTVGGTALTAKVALYWDEWEDNTQG